MTITKSPVTIGDDAPVPANCAFHAMFFVALHSTGSPVSADTPWLPGPRHCGQSSAHTPAAHNIAAHAASTIDFTPPVYCARHRDTMSPA